ncbi:MAG: hypothetical protein LBU77_05830 [Clostridiales bacterium]|nr:hypothetical protein [Clostridiales bacterium]
MNIHKKVLGTLDMVYAATAMQIGGELNYIAASEGQNGCVAYHADSFEKQIIWDARGGTMNVIPLPDRDGEFIATQGFYPTFAAQESRIVYGKFENGQWNEQPIMTIPYLHRFDIFKLNGALYFIGATLCTSKKNQDDWSDPGKVYVGKLHKNIAEPFELTTVLEGITKNHGFCAAIWHKKRAYIVTGVEGAFVIYLPENNEGFTCEKILDHEISDIAVADIDGDGMDEIATLEPFHGNKGVIYKNIAGSWQQIYACNLAFAHVVWGGSILNKPSFIIGERKGDTKLLCIQAKEHAAEALEVTLIDHTGGTSNIAVVHHHDKDVILAANREIGETAIYELTEGKEL